ncbi:3-oxoacyl-[acyl-carrier-protein] reductase FabG-like [Lineus longissimus]|uniref:3-oxoacyl-[acyl-carrier-protein] reductase FabG-like n=1 Tax=Lineus longissimus TaxID=88925 RepID=UPI00315DF44B
MAYSHTPDPLESSYTRGRFQGKAAMVTGGASGIGLATVDRLSNDGAAVAILDISEELGHAEASRLRELGRDVDFYHVDVTDKEQCLQAVSTHAARHGGEVHFLVNCAAFFGSQGISATQRDWDRSLGVNVVGTSNMVQVCEPYMKNGKECSVVNLCSICASRANPQRWTYCSTKGAIKTMTKCMALDLAQRGIRVNAVSPGFIWTQHLAPATNFNHEAADSRSGKFHMLGRIGNPEEIASVIAFLCGKDASFITGSNIPVDGGYLAMSAEGMGDPAFVAGSDIKG